MKRYKNLLFDLFNTVALWHPERMPRLTWAGETRPSTLGELGKLLAARAPQVSFEEFHAALTATSAELALEVTRDRREIPSRERFGRSLLRVGLAPGEATAALAEDLSLRHMALLANASAVPPAHVTLLERLAEHYALALVSNFDHAPTARAILKRDGVADYFQHLVISESHGWRKPHTRIFDDTLTLLGSEASEALFVGDSVEDDVVGAHGAGIDVAWINARSVALPGAVKSPAYTLKAITELEPMLLPEAAP